MRSSMSSRVHSRVRTGANSLRFLDNLLGARVSVFCALASFLVFAGPLAGCDDEAGTNAGLIGPNGIDRGGGGPNDLCGINEECPAGEPLCDTDRLQCAECLGDGDCPAAQPACDSSDGECRECLSDGHCPDSEPICDPLELECRSACTSNADCENMNDDLPICDPDTGRCFACTANADCTDGDRRVCDSRGACVECA